MELSFLFWWIIPYILIQQVWNCLFYSDGLSHTYWYNKYGIVFFILMDYPIHIDTTSVELSFLFWWIIPYILIQQVRNCLFYSDGLSHTYWYNKCGIVFFILMDYPIHIDTTSMELSFLFWWIIPYILIQQVRNCLFYSDGLSHTYWYNKHKLSFSVWWIIPYILIQVWNYLFYSDGLSHTCIHIAIDTISMNSLLFWWIIPYILIQ